MNWVRKLWPFVLMSMLVVLLAGCRVLPSTPAVSANVVETLSGNPDAGFARAYEPMAFHFPRDHGPHPEFQTEWWYYTGNLMGDNGESYGYQLTFFRNALAPQLPERRSALATNQAYMAHFALTDGAASRHDAFERYSRGAGGLAGATGQGRYAVWLEDWSARELAPGQVQLLAAAQGEEGAVGLDLILHTDGDPLLHGNAGLSQKGPEPGTASYYYSLVGLETTGQIVSGGESVQVSGISWMDHEFGTGALSRGTIGWDWFGLQLEDGTALMFGQIRAQDGGIAYDFTGTMAEPGGSQIALPAQDLELDFTRTWTSPHTGITYPAGWLVRIPAHDLTLEISPLIPDQEIRHSFVYWEGAVEVTAIRSGEVVPGRGYVELTGYGVSP